jgi:hypothetical protein
MLTVDREQHALLTVANQYRQFRWERWLLADCAVFHLLGSIVLYAQGHDTWAWAFLAGAVFATVVVFHVTTATQLAAWFIVFPLGATWLGAVIIHLDSGGSPLGLIVWPIIYSHWVVAAVRVALGKR